MDHTAKILATVAFVVASAVLGMMLVACQAPEHAKYEDPTKTYDVISVSQFVKTETNGYGGVIDQNLAYYVTYADTDGNVQNIELVPDTYHTVQVSTDGTNTVTITPAGAHNETVRLVVTQEMLAQSGGQLQSSPAE